MFNTSVETDFDEIPIGTNKSSTKSTGNTITDSNSKTMKSSPSPKPFLKKGSRREPSALSRLNSKISNYKTNENNDLNNKFNDNTLDMGVNAKHQVVLTKNDNKTYQESSRKSNDIYSHQKDGYHSSPINFNSNPLNMSVDYNSTLDNSFLDGSNTIQNMDVYAIRMQQSSKRLHEQRLNDLSEFEELENYVDHHAASVNKNTNSSISPQLQNSLNIHQRDGQNENAVTENNKVFSSAEYLSLNSPVLTPPNPNLKEAKDTHSSFGTKEPKDATQDVYTHTNGKHSIHAHNNNINKLSDSVSRRYEPEYASEDEVVYDNDDFYEEDVEELVRNNSEEKGRLSSNNPPINESLSMTSSFKMVQIPPVSTSSGSHSNRFSGDVTIENDESEYHQHRHQTHVGRDEHPNNYHNQDRHSPHANVRVAHSVHTLSDSYNRPVQYRITGKDAKGIPITKPMIANTVHNEGHSKQQSVTNQHYPMAQRDDAMHSQPHQPNEDASERQLKLQKKAKELEEMLEVYRRDNQKLKDMKDEQEKIQAQMLEDKQKLKEWIASEKTKCEEDCEKQKQQLKIEKRNAMKEINDIKCKLLLEQEHSSFNTSGNASTTASATPSIAVNGNVSAASAIRNYRKEIDALKVTIEKYKVDVSTTAKKTKANEKRMQDVIKDLTQTNANLQSKLKANETQKLEFIKYLNANHIKFPKKFLLDGSNAESSNVGNSKQRCNSATRNRFNATNSSSNSSIGNSNNGSTASHVDIDSRSMRSSKKDPLGYSPYKRTNTVALTDSSNNKGLTESTNNEIPDNYWNTHTRSTAQHGVSNVNPQTPNPNEIFDHNSEEEGSFIVTVGEEDASYVVDAGNRLTINEERSVDEGENGMLSKSLFQTAAHDDLYKVTTGQKHMNSSTKSISNQHQPINTTHGVNTTVANANSSSSGRIETIGKNGQKVITYRNGTVKEVFDDMIRIIFTNGDIKETDTTGTGCVSYFYREAQTTHITHPDGLETYKFANGQVEKHFPNGDKHVTFPDGTEKHVLGENTTTK